MGVARWLRPICEEIKNDPLSKGYAKMSDAEVADALNAPIEIDRLVHQDEVKAWATKYRVLKRIIDAEKQNTALFKECELVFTGAQQQVDFSNPGSQGIVTDLIKEGIITQDEANELFALSKTTTTRAKQLGVNRTIAPAHIATCRAEG